MSRLRYAAATLALSCLVGANAGAQELRIGVLLTLSGSIGFIGNEMRDAWNLGMAEEGWAKDGDKFGGVPTKVIWADDQGKTDVAVQAVEKMLRGDRVQIVAGVMLSNVAMAIRPLVTDARRLLVHANGSPAPIAGTLCSPYFVSTAFQNDTIAEAMGELLTKEGIKKVYLVAPNYQAGKDYLAGFERHFRGGTIVDRNLFKLGEADFQSDISKIRASGADAVFGFVPAGMGIAFLKQWDAAGMNKVMKLYTIFSVDNLSLGALGNSAVGTFHTNFWAPDSKLPANQKFVSAFVAKFKREPSHYAVQAYDAARLIAAAVKSLDGKIESNDMMPIARALRSVKFESPRGDFRFNVNGMPIQDVVKREVVVDDQGKPRIIGRGAVFTAHKDSYWQQCPEAKRLP